MHSSSIHFASILPEFRSIIVVFASFGLLSLAVMATLRAVPEFGFKVRGFLRTIRIRLTGVRHQAHMADMSCPECRKGTGVYDPIFVNYNGIPHWEGNCNHCLTYVRGRVN